MHVRPLFRVTWLAIVSAAALWSVAPALAQTGVDDDRVSLPDGPGSLEGFGDDVEVDPNMGAMSYSVAVELPPGFEMATPSSSLSYNSGSGSGPLGIGWSMSVPSVTRMTSRGVPLYDTTDEIDVGGNELVLVDDTDPERLVYRSRFEKEFSRYLWVSSNGGADGYWIAELPDGTRQFFGATRQGQIVDSARSAGSEGTARFLLVEQVDVWGHAVRYEYDAFDSTWPLLTGISWLDDGTGSDRDLYSVELTYEDRPDFLSDASVGFEELLTRRLRGLTIRNGSQTVREYVLTYQEDLAAGGFSRLAQVEKYGLGGVADGTRHPGVQTFDYSQALGVDCVAGMDCAAPRMVDMGAIPGGVDMTNGQATLIDINADGLPDVLDTTEAGVHRFYINTLTAHEDGSFTHRYLEGGESGLQGAGSFQIGTGDAVQTVDVNGDGLSDLLDTTTGSWLVNDRESADWAEQGSLNSVTALQGLDFSDARFLDIDEDKRIDIITSDQTTTTVYRNLGDRFQADTTVQPLGMTIGSGATTRFADLNGDGLNDPVQISTDGLISYRLNYGHGRWGQLETIDNLDIDPTHVSLVDLEDLNGDGISDVVLVTGAQVAYAINRNGARFDDLETVTTATLGDGGGEIPDRTNKTVLYADLNGNGSEDIVWIDASGNVQYLELFPTRPNLLTRIDNGLGAVQKVTYGTAAEHAARARDLEQQPWTFSLQIPMQVVDEIDLFVTVTGSEDGSGLHNVTRYAYRDGFYDGLEKQYRGFERVVVNRPELDSMEAAETRHRYDVGREAPWRNGLMLEEITLSGGRELTTVTSEYDSCTVAEVPTPAALEALDRRGVYWPCQLAEQTLIKEGLTDESQWLTTRTEFQYDGYGNQTLVSNLGIVGQDGDEDFTRTAYARPAGDTWLINYPSREEHSALDSFPASDTNVSITYYDGESFIGLPEGTVERGFVSRKTTAIDANTTLDAERARHDDHGNAVETIDPNGTLEGTDHRRTYDYDASGKYLTTTDLHLGDYSLRRESIFETDFGKLVESTQWMLVENGEVRTARDSTMYRYDEFGRLALEILPGATQDAPSVVYTYELGAPFSRIIAEAASTAGGPLDERAVTCLDGRGRTYQTRTLLADDRYQVDGFTAFNARGAEIARYQPFTSDSDACEAEPPSGVPVVTTRFDASGRELEVEQPAETIYGERTTTRTVYRPLATDRYDAEDTDPDSPHADTPTTWRDDGLDRLVERIRRIEGEDGIQEVSLTLHYDATNSFAGYTDAQGNRHELVVDLAERVTSVTNPSTGTKTFVYDDAGNIVSVTDTRGVTVETSYDGQNRLVERFDPANRDASLVTWHYDTAPEGCAATDCTQLAGKLAAVRYPVDLGHGRVEQGEDRFGYDARRRSVFAARRLGMLADLVTRREYDARNRVTAVVHPNGTRVESSYDVAGRLEALPGYVDAIGYDARGLWTSVDSANGSRLERTLDDLQREAGRALTAGDGTAVFGHELTRNRTDHITQIVDTVLADGVPSADALITHDAWYRPTSVELGMGAETLSFGFDGLDRLVSASSSDAASASHRGALEYANQPLAVVSAGSLALSYDAAGQLTGRGTRTFTRDELGRLAGVLRAGEPVGAMVYADTDRVVQRSDLDGTLVLYGFDHFEVRDGVARSYVRMDREHLARTRTTSQAASIYPNPDGDDQITAGDAYQAVRAGDTALPTRTVLAAAAARLLAEQEDATTWLHVDHLGSVVAATTQGGEVRGQRGFYPFGQERFHTGDVDVHGFTGQEHDTATTGLIHMKHRELDPIAGRWDRFDPAFERLSADDLQKLGEAAAGYAYVANSPFDGVDPSGLNKFTNLFTKKGRKQNKLDSLKEKRQRAVNKKDYAETWQNYNNKQVNYWKGLKALNTNPQNVRHIDKQQRENQRFKEYYSDQSSHYTRKIKTLDRQIQTLKNEINSMDTASQRTVVSAPPSPNVGSDTSSSSVQPQPRLQIVITEPQPPGGPLPTINE